VQQYIDDGKNDTKTFSKRKFRYLDLNPDYIRQLMPQLWTKDSYYEVTKLMKEVIDKEHVPTEEEITEYATFIGIDPQEDKSLH